MDLARRMVRERANLRVKLDVEVTYSVTSCVQLVSTNRPITYAIDGRWSGNTGRLELDRVRGSITRSGVSEG